MCATGSMSRTTRARCLRSCMRGTVGADLLRRRTLRADQPRGRRGDLRLDGRACAERARSDRAAHLITFVADRPGHDLRYAIDASKIAARPRLAAARDVRVRPAQDGRMVSRQSQLVGAHPQRRLSRRAAGGRCVILVFGGNGQLGQELTRASARARGAAGRALPRAGRHRPTRRPCVTLIRRYSPSLVVNAAAYTKVDLAETETEAARAGERSRTRACSRPHARRPVCR